MAATIRPPASAVDDATLLLVRKQDFQALCLAHPEVALKVLRVVGARLRRLVAHYRRAVVHHGPPPPRVLPLPPRPARRQAHRRRRDHACPAGNQELASQIGTVRELVSRNLSRFQQEGLLTVDGRRVVIRDLAALEAELQDTGQV